ncbi:MAG: cytochrome c [Gammaproteobacteria bacterium]|nr:cytochrome c [Gammaproteobacteria bacterium]
MRASIRLAVMASCIVLSARAADSPPLTSGQTLYQQGTHGESPHPSCASCHGVDGLGIDGTAPAVHWTALTSEDHQPGYDRTSLLKALSQGIAPDQRRLSAQMPRYALDDDVLDSLIDHLQQLSAATDTGIEPTRVLVGISGNSDLDIGFSAAIAAFNSQGGAFGRRIEVTTRPDVLTTLTEIDDRLEERLQTACLVAAVKEVRNTSAQRVGLLGRPGDEFRFRLMTMSLPLSAAADVTLVASDNIVDELENGELLDTPRTLVGCLDHLGEHAAALAEAGHEVILAIPHQDALSWAALHDQGPEALRGYALGALLGEALAAAGADLTPERLNKALESIALTAQTVYLEPRFTPRYLLSPP